MNILNRYIIREATVFFLITLFAFTGILLTVRMLQFAALIINKGVAATNILVVFAAIIPTFLEIALPMATLLGIMLAFARMSGDSEIIVIRASGISLLQLLKPVLFLAVIFALINLYVSIQLRPWGNYQLAQSLFEIAKSKSTAGLNAGIFNKLGKITLYAEKIDDKNGNLHRVLIDDKREGESRKIVVAQEGRIISDEKTRSIMLHLNNGHIHEILNKNYALTKFTSNNLLLDLAELEDGGDEPRSRKSRELYLWELRATIEKYSALQNELKIDGKEIKDLSQADQDILKADAISDAKDLKRKTMRLKTEAGRRFSMPYATFILAILGLPLGIIPPRTQKTWGVGLSVTLGMAVFTAYYVLLSLGITFGESGKISPYFGLWIPNIVATIVVIYVLRKVTTEKWTSIAHGLEIFIGRMLKALHLRKE